MQVPCWSPNGRLPIRIRPSGVSWLIWLTCNIPPKNKTVSPITTKHECLSPRRPWKIASVSCIIGSDIGLFNPPSWNISVKNVRICVSLKSKRPVRLLTLRRKAVKNNWIRWVFDVSPVFAKKSNLRSVPILPVLKWECHFNKSQNDSNPIILSEW